MSLISLIISPFVLFTGLMHNYHVSIVDITYKRDLGKIEISQKLFVDDFEKALMLEGKVFKFGNDLKDENSTKAIISYLNNHFSIEVNGEVVEMKYIGAEWEDYHAFYVFWELDVANDLDEINIFNDVFLKVSNDQQNMHYLKVADKKKSLLLQEGKTRGSIKF